MAPARSFARSSNKEKTFTFPVERPFKTHRISENLPTKVETTAAELLSFWRDMTRMRRLEIAADNLYKAKEIRGFCHLYNGQEAVCTGLEAALTKEDHIITAYRDHTFQLGRGDTPRRILAELTGRRSGCSAGKGGSMHMYLREKNFYGGNGIVGAQVPVGAGIAFAQKFLKTGRVAVALYGDGAANQGQVFEAYNMAAIWQLPVLFVCENNHYAMGTAVNRAAATPNFYTRGDYVPGLWIDGMDVLAVKAGVQWAAEYARKTGPLVLEMNTYRYVGHSMSDPDTTYRTRDEKDKVRQTNDPINKVRSRLLDNQLATEEELKQIETDIKKEIDDAVEHAKAAAWPPLDDTYTDVYTHPTPVRGVERTILYQPK